MAGPPAGEIASTLIRISDEQFREKAKELHEKEGTLEIDAEAVVSRSSDGGAYVASWVWVQNSDVTGDDDDDADEAALPDEDLSACETCGVEVRNIIGCPDGTAVCPECFENGQH